MIRHLLLSGGPTHPFEATSAEIVDLLEQSPGETFHTTVVTEPAAAIDLLGQGTWDLLTVNAMRWRMEADRYAHLREGQAFDLLPADAEVLANHVTQGGGLLALHTAVICFDAQPAWHELLGAAWNWTRSSHPPLGDVSVSITDTGRDHAITAGVDGFHLIDEIYRFLDEVDDVEPLLTASPDDRSQPAIRHPVLWARSVGRGRVVTDLLGHGVESLANPTHRRILQRAAQWAAGREQPEGQEDR